MDELHRNNKEMVYRPADYYPLLTEKWQLEKEVDEAIKEMKSNSEETTKSLF